MKSTVNLPSRCVIVCAAVCTIVLLMYVMTATSSSSYDVMMASRDASSSYHHHHHTGLIMSPQQHDPNTADGAMAERDAGGGVSSSSRKRKWIRHSVSQPQVRSSLQQEQPQGQQQQQQSSRRRLIERTANIQATVPQGSMDTALTAMRRAALDNGGYVAAEQSSWSGRGLTAPREVGAATMTLKVPSERLDATIERVRRVGRVVNFRQSSREVTAAMESAELRTAVSENDVGSYISLLRAATKDPTVKDDKVLQLLAQLTAHETLLLKEQVSKRRLQHSVDYASIQVMLREVPPKQELLVDEESQSFVWVAHGLRWSSWLLVCCVVVGYRQVPFGVLHVAVRVIRKLQLKVQTVRASMQPMMKILVTRCRFLIDAFCASFSEPLAEMTQQQQDEEELREFSVEKNQEDISSLCVVKKENIPTNQEDIPQRDPLTSTEEQKEEEPQQQHDLSEQLPHQ